MDLPNFAFCFTGTMSACVKLVEAAKGTVLECYTVIELAELKGRSKISAPVSVIVEA